PHERAHWVACDNGSTERDGGVEVSMANAQTAPGGVPPGWETRIYSGVQVADVSLKSRSALASALGEVGVEAEYVLTLLAAFPDPDRPAPGAAERLYGALEAWAGRVAAAAATLEVATQGYLGELEALYPELRDKSGDISEVWWPPFAGYTLAGEPLA